MGYGTRDLARVSHAARTVRFGAQSVPNGQGRLADVFRLFFSLCRVARLTVALSDKPPGRLIHEHLSLRRWGVPRFRLAQGVLHLPEDFALYTRGRSRQAVRTNVRHALKNGITCECVIVRDWRWPLADRVLEHQADTEHWTARNVHGELVGEAWLTVDDDTALLHVMACQEPHVRWLLHTKIVERLCSSSCSVLLTNSVDVPLLSPGQQHFQQLLGYSIARLSPRRFNSPIPEGRPGETVWLDDSTSVTNALGARAE